ncbi:MAG: hypothetical protein Q4A42_03165 [Tissierellia bacterium]|nr:hypothetical protein [Tissierellia bacterium]
MYNEKELKLDMLEKDISIEMLAKQLNKSRQAIYKKINGQTEWSLQDIRTMKKMFGWSDLRIRQIFF